MGMDDGENEPTGLTIPRQNVHRRSSILENIQEEMGQVGQSKEKEILFQNRTLKDLTKLAEKGALERTAWIVLFLLTTVGCCYHFYFLTSRYLQYPLVEASDFGMIDFRFPDVVMCHGIDSNTAKQLYKVPNRADGALLFDLVMNKNMQNLWSYALYGVISNNLSAALTNEQFSNASRVSFYSLAGYDAYNNNMLLGPEDFIYYCQYGPWKCDFTNFTYIRHSKFGHCMRFRPSDAAPLGLAGNRNGLFLYFLLSYKRTRQLNLTTFSTDILGMRVFVSERYSWFANGTYLVQFNKQDKVDISVQRSAYFKVDSPTSPCYNGSLITRCFLGRNKRVCEGMLADEVLCEQDVYQDELYRLCGCISYNWLLRPEYLDVDFCLEVPRILLESNGLLFNGSTAYANISDGGIDGSGAWNLKSLSSYVNATKMVQRMQCYDKFQSTFHYTYDMSQKCTSLCQSYQMYTTDNRFTYSNPFVDPATDVFTDLLNDIVTKYNNSNVSSVFSNATYNYMQVTGKWYTQSSLTFEPASLEVFPRSLYGDMTSQDYAYLFRTFVADIGGALGLWVGVTVMTLLEFMEVIYFIIHYLVKKKETQ